MARACLMSLHVRLPPISSASRRQVAICLAGRAAEERAALLGLTSGVGVESDLKDLRDARAFSQGR